MAEKDNLKDLRETAAEKLSKKGEHLKAGHKYINLAQIDRENEELYLNKIKREAKALINENNFEDSGKLLLDLSMYEKGKEKYEKEK